MRCPYRRHHLVVVLMFVVGVLFIPKQSFAQG